jgi:hypothetical protein
MQTRVNIWGRTFAAIEDRRRDTTDVMAEARIPHPRNLQF